MHTFSYLPSKVPNKRIVRLFTYITYIIRETVCPVEFDKLQSFKTTFLILFYLQGHTTSRDLAYRKNATRLDLIQTDPLATTLQGAAQRRRRRGTVRPRQL